MKFSFIPYVDFDGTITSKDIPYNSFLQFETKRILSKPNRRIVNILKQRKFYILSHTCSWEKPFIWLFLIKAGIAKNCLKILTTCDNRYIKNRIWAFDMKAKIILDGVSQQILSGDFKWNNLWFQDFSYLYIDGDEETKGEVLNRIRLELIDRSKMKP